MALSHTISLFLIKFASSSQAAQLSGFRLTES